MSAKASLVFLLRMGLLGASRDLSKCFDAVIKFDIISKARFRL